MSSLVSILVEVAASVTLLAVEMAVSLVVELVVVIYSIFGKTLPEDHRLSKRRRGHAPRKCPVLFALVAGIGLFLFLVVLVADVFFSDRLLASFVNKQAARRGLTLSYDQGDLSLFRGELSLGDVEVQKDGLNVHVEEVSLETSLWAAMFGNASLVRISGVRGVVPEGLGFSEKSRMPRFEINSLIVEDVALLLQDNSNNCGMATIRYFRNAQHDPLVFELDYFVAQPMSSASWCNNILFNSTGRGTLGETPFEVSTFYREGRRIGVLRQIRNLPVNALRDWVGGPFSFMEGGLVDVQMESGSLEDRYALDLKWRWVFRGVRPAVGKGSLLTTRMAAEVARQFEGEEQVPIDYTLKVRKQDYEGPEKGPASFRESVEQGLLGHLIVGSSKEQNRPRLERLFEVYQSKE